MTLTNALAREYARLYATLEIRRDRLPEVDRIVHDQIIKHRSRYESVSRLTGDVPWWFIGAIHSLESGSNWRTHLHNGDPLTARTVQVPSGRPISGNPPFTWEASAIDALRMRGLDKVKLWTVPRTLHCAEGYNGWGYRRFHPDVLSPYMFAGSWHYVAGKYVADGKWSQVAVSKQIGAAVLIHRLQSLGLVRFAE